LALQANVGIGKDGADVTMAALPYRPSLILRGESDDLAFRDACRAALGFDLPLAPNHVNHDETFAALWLGPSEWLVVGDGGQEKLAACLEAGPKTCHFALINNGDGQQVIALSGPKARDVLAKLCPLDLDSPDLAPGRCARSVLAGIAMTLWPQYDKGDSTCGGYRIHVGRSFADYAWRIIADAAIEYSEE
jgi:sarcosine oxidase subunit gamma